MRKDLLLTWGIDGKVCLWDSFSVGEVFVPLCTLISHPNYPIYALDIYGRMDAKLQAGDKPKVHIAIGGGAEGGFLGVPAYIYDV